MLDVIAFDADDTLWQTEIFYTAAAQDFISLLEKYTVSPEQTRSKLHTIEIDNLAFFGYGIRGYILSMIETAIQLTAGKVQAQDIQAIIEIGRGMTQHEIHLLEGVQEALSSLQGRRLMLITKGDALDQESKLLRSGLSTFFSHVEVVVDKTSTVYARLLTRHGIDPNRFLMVGNSLRSDIAPVLELGSYAVYVPYPNGWAHESVADLPQDRSRFFEIANLHALPEAIQSIEQ